MVVDSPAAGAAATFTLPGLPAAVLSASPDGVLAFDRECRYTVWNAAMERMTALSAADVLGRVAFEVFPFLVDTGEDWCFHEALGGRLASSADRPFTVPATGHSGFYEARYAPLWHDGQVAGGVCVVRDVSARVRARRGAERALRLHTLVLERMTEGVSVSDEAGIIVYTNPAEDRMFGYAAGELVGQHVTVQNGYPPGENARRVAAVIEQLRTRGYWEGEWENVRKDGTHFVTHARITALVLDGRMHWVCVQEDITERRDAEREREQLLLLERVARAEAEQARTEAEAANRAKSEFLAVMSHELRTPLNAIGGYAEIVELGIHGPVTDAQRDALARIRKSQRHLLGLINEVLNYARVESGKVQYELADVAAGAALAEVEALVSPQVRAKGVALQVDECDVGLLARADPEKLRQILLNLLSNAVKFTDGGGRVTLRCEARGANLAFAISDTGVGIPPDKLEAIFEPFVQVHAGLTRTAEGTGLGLAISRDLARGMAGDLTVESVPGAGSTFTLLVPRAARG